MEYVCFWLGKECCLSSSQCQRIGAVLNQMKEEIAAVHRWGAGERTQSIASEILFHVFILLCSWTNCRRPPPKESRLAWIKTWLQVSLICVCVRSLCLAEEWGSWTNSHTCGTPLKQAVSFPFLSQYLYLVYKPSSSSFPEEMVTFRTFSPEARLEQFQGAALVTCRRSLMDGKLQQGELTFLSCLFAGLLWKHVHFIAHFCFPRQRCCHADKIRLCSSKVCFLSWLLVVY